MFTPQIGDTPSSVPMGKPADWFNRSNPQGGVIHGLGIVVVQTLSIGEMNANDVKNISLQDDRLRSQDPLDEQRAILWGFAGIPNDPQLGIVRAVWVDVEAGELEVGFSSVQAGNVGDTRVCLLVLPRF
jgi:hypothetical protein